MNLINTNQNAQYGIAPFERKEIIIGATVNPPDRSRGSLIAELEGTGFYIERADYPVLINIGHGFGGLESSIMARDGLEIEAGFKGLTLTHPVLNDNARLSLMLFKNGARMTNNLDTPVTRMPVPWRIETNTAVLQSDRIFVFPGARGIRNLQMTLNVVTTLTGVGVNFIDVTGALITPATGLQQTVGGVLQSYVQAGSPPAPVFSTLGGFNVLSWENIFIPFGTVEIQVFAVGTGFTGSSLSGNFE